MKLENKTARNYIAYDVILKANSVQEVTNKEAIKILLKQVGVCEFADIKKQQDLEAENEKLKKEIELAKAKEEAAALGIEFSPKIGLEKLLVRIDETKQQRRQNQSSIEPKVQESKVPED